MTFSQFMQYLTNGISLGSLYALIAIGYTMVYGILRLINFAHGDIFMMSLYFAFYGVAMFSLPWQITFLMAVLMTALLGMTVERAAYKPIRQSPRITVMVSAIGASFFLQNLGIVLFGGRPKAFPTVPMFTRVIQIGTVSLQALTLYIPVATVILLVMLHFLINKTKTGLAMRAASRDHDTARLMGVNVNRTITITFAIGSILAAFGGIMWGMKFPQIAPTMGLMPGLKCFIAAVVGGIGNIPGAVLGGFVLGIGEIMLVAFLPGLTGYRDAFAFVLLIIILLVRPTGLLGEKTAEKV